MASRQIFPDISRCVSPVPHANPFVPSLRFPYNGISERRITYKILIPSSIICHTRACVPDGLLRGVCDQGVHDVLLVTLRFGWRADRPGWHPLLRPERRIPQNQRIRKHYMLQPRPQVLWQAEVTDGRVRVPSSLFLWTGPQLHVEFWELVCQRDGHVSLTGYSCCRM